MKETAGYISATVCVLAFSSVAFCAQGGADPVAVPEARSALAAPAAAPEPAPTPHPAAAAPQTEGDRLAAPPVPLAPATAGAAKTAADWAHAIEVCTAEVN